MAGEHGKHTQLSAPETNNSFTGKVSLFFPRVANMGIVILVLSPVMLLYPLLTE